MAILEPSGAFNLRQQFYELLTDFATFPAAQNFFLVNIKNVPGGPLSETGVITEQNVRNLGIRTNSNVNPFGLDIAKNQIFKKYFDGYMFLATGVDLTTETTSVNNKGTLINGLLPVGPFMESREYPDNNLDIQFSETNISIIDTVFRSWIQLYSVYGNMNDKPLSTDVTIYFISKQKPGLKDSPVSTRPIGPGHSTWDAAIEASEGTSQFVSRPGYDTTPVVTKIYSYKDCIPYIIKSANVGQYDGDVQLGSVAVGWRFSRYDVRVPVYSNPSTPSPTNRPEFDDGAEMIGGVEFNAFTEGNVGEGSGQEETLRTDRVVRSHEIADDFLYDEVEESKKLDEISRARVDQELERIDTEETAKRKQHEDRALAATRRRILGEYSTPKEASSPEPISIVQDDTPVNADGWPIGSLAEQGINETPIGWTPTTPEPTNEASARDRQESRDPGRGSAEERQKVPESTKKQRVREADPRNYPSSSGAGGSGFPGG